MSDGTIHLGTCGYGYYDAPTGWKDQYETKLQAFTHDFDLLEVQKSFYKLPQTKTCEKWKNRADEGFTFTLKAWQALTHTIQSPTWRGNDDQLTEEQRQHFGNLRPNEEVINAWDETMERARALDAPIIVIQCPASFEPTVEHESNLRSLMSAIDRDGVRIAWEPRGEWLEKPDRVSTICNELELIHTVDLLRREPFYVGSTAYVRLHGLNDDPYNYDYDYSKNELKQLRDRLRELADTCDNVYCLFNNFQKFSNLRQLEELLW
ncbi:MAG: DUF72 domain-containing protein [bacterium]